MQDVDVVRNVGPLGLSMDGPAAYLKRVMPMPSFTATAVPKIS